MTCSQSSSFISVLVDLEVIISSLKETVKIQKRIIEKQGLAIQILENHKLNL